MATQTMKLTIKLKRAKSTEWPSNYKLQPGEPGFELDTGKLKIGDGSTTWAELPYTDATNFMKGFDSAELGQVPSKAQNGAITWITPLTESNIINSNNFNNWLENKILEASNRTYKGEAALLSENNGIITLLDSNYEPIEADINDVYSYEGSRYLWTGAEWVELTEDEIYATKQSVDTLTLEVNALQTHTGGLGSYNNNGSTVNHTVKSYIDQKISNIDIANLSQSSVDLVLDCGNASGWSSSEQTLPD